MNARTKHMTSIGFKAVTSGVALILAELAAWNDRMVQHLIALALFVVIFAALVEHIVDNFHKRASEDAFPPVGTNETKDKRND